MDLIPLANRAILGGVWSATFWSRSVTTPKQSDFSLQLIQGIENLLAMILISSLPGSKLNSFPIGVTIVVAPVQIVGQCR